MMDRGAEPNKAGADETGLCLDCARLVRACAPGHRVVRHPELTRLAIAHVDCDAFYASVEKRDRPELAAQPVIVGGGMRGVVTTACYIARLSGVKSAMPMATARRLCPHAVVIAPDFNKYRAVAGQLRTLFETLTPLVQPLSIDEAVLDLSGTEALHGAPPAVSLARLARRVEHDIGITLSIGLAGNRMLAKLAAERGKPRGFSVLGTEAPAWLGPQPVSLLPGIGPAQTARLAARGITRLVQLQSMTDAASRALLGPEGPLLAARARGEDPRHVHRNALTRSISAETTLAQDRADAAALSDALWPLCEKLARRLRTANLAASGVTLKLKNADFALRTRTLRLTAPTTLPDTLFDHAITLLGPELDGTAFRLIGLAAAPLLPADQADKGDLLDTETPRRASRQAAIDRLAERFGPNAVRRGRGLGIRRE